MLIIEKNDNQKTQTSQEYINTLNNKDIGFSDLPKKEKKTSLVKIFFAIIIVLGILYTFFFDKNIFKIENNQSVTIISGEGNYVCNVEDSDNLDNLKPVSLDETIYTELYNEMQRLNNEKAEIEAMKNQKNITAEDRKNLQTKIDKNSQDIIVYNQKSITYQKEVDEYNRKVLAYNDYLHSHCEKIK